MKKRISALFIRIALWLNPDAKELLAPVVDGYEAGKVGVGYQITKKDLREYMKSKNVSYRRATKELKKLRKNSVRCAIYKKIDELIEWGTDKHGKQYDVYGCVKVYKKRG